MTPTHHPTPADDPHGPLRPLLAGAAPLAIIALLLGCYLASPDFYLTYVLEESRREYQAVELLTSICGALATALLLYATIRLWRTPSQRLQPPGEAGPGERLLADRGGAKIIAVITLATFFFTGEEMSWGQTYLNWNTPEVLQQQNLETNLHNLKSMPISIQSLGSAFLLCVFVGLPVAWRFREQLHLPKTWTPAIAEGPVVFSLVVAFAWKLFKSLYRIAVNQDAQQHSTFYRDFIEQINEQKELLVAVALLMYALYRVAAVRRLRADRATQNKPG